MKFRLIAALALVSTAIASASPALATQGVRLHEHRNETVANHRSMETGQVPKSLFALPEEAPKMMHDNEWPNDLILGSLQTHQEFTTAAIVAI